MNLGKGLGGILDASDIAQQALLVAHRERDQLEGVAGVAEGHYGKHGG